MTDPNINLLAEFYVLIGCNIDRNVDSYYFFVTNLAWKVWLLLLYLVT